MGWVRVFFRSSCSKSIKYAMKCCIQSMINASNSSHWSSVQVGSEMASSRFDQ